MIDHREVQHLIRQNKKIKAKIVEQARVYQEERAKLKAINRSLQKTLEDEKEKNRATIEEFNAKIIALEAELKRVRSNEPQVTNYTTARSRPLKPISFAQLEAESKRLAEETNRIIQQTQSPSKTFFMSPPPPNVSNNAYQTSKFSNSQSYRTRYQFNLSDNYPSSNNFNQIPQQLPQQQPQQFQQSIPQQNYGKTQPYLNPTNNKITNSDNSARQENYNVQQIYQQTQQKPQKNSTLPSPQPNSNSFPFSSNQHLNNPAQNIVIEEEEEELETNHDQQIDDASNDLLSDDTVPAEDENPVINDTINNSQSDDQKEQKQSQQNTAHESSKSSSISSGQTQPPAATKEQKSSPPKNSPANEANKNKTQNPTINQISVSNNKKPQNKADQKAATSPGISVIINDESKNSEDPFADNFLDDDFREEEPNSNDQSQQKQQEAPMQEKVQQNQKEEQPKSAQPEKQKQPAKESPPTPKKDTFMNDIPSTIFDDISFNHDVMGSDLDMEAAFNAPSQSITQTNNSNEKKKVEDKEKKLADKQNNKKNETQEDVDEIHVPSAGSWSFPSSQIQIEGFD